MEDSTSPIVGAMVKVGEAVDGVAEGLAVVVVAVDGAGDGDAVGASLPAAGAW